MTLRLTVAAAVLTFTVATPSVPALAQSPAQSFVYGEKQFRHACRPPLKFAAGACVRRRATASSHKDGPRPPVLYDFVDRQCVGRQGACRWFLRRYPSSGLGRPLP